jgi:hypothetical protein
VAKVAVTDIEEIGDDRGMSDENGLFPESSGVCELPWLVCAGAFTESTQDDKSIVIDIDPVERGYLDTSIVCSVYIGSSLRIIPSRPARLGVALVNVVIVEPE